MLILGVTGLLLGAAGQAKPDVRADSINRVYLAEGTTRPGFQEFLSVANSGAQAPATITFMFADGTSGEQRVTLPARGRTTIDVNRAVGPGRDVAISVDAGPNPNVTAERTMYFNICFGSICVQGNSIDGGQAPSSAWYFAEGHVGDGFQEFLTLLNPASEPAQVTVAYVQGTGPTSKTYQVPALSRSTIDVNHEIGSGDVALEISSPGSIAAERALYFNACLPQCVDGGDVGSGGSPRTDWSFAEGFTGPGFQEYLTILNPGPATAHVSVSYGSFDTTSSDQALTVAAGARRTIDVNAAVRSWEVSARLTSDQPVVAERVKYYRSCIPTCYAGGEVALGLQPRAVWSFAEGYTGAGFQEYLTLANPNPTPVTAQITYFISGQPTVAGSIQVGPGIRSTVDVNQSIGAGREVAANIVASSPIVVERPMYFSGCLASVCVHPSPPLGPAAPAPPQPAAPPAGPPASPPPGGPGPNAGQGPGPSPAPTAAPRGLSNAGGVVSALADSKSGHLSIAIREFGGSSPQSWNYHSGDVFVAASTYKLVAMMGEAEHIAEGTMQPDGEICYQSSDATDDSTYSDYVDGACFSRTELASRAGQVSDNIAGHMLVRDLGGAGPLNDYAAQHGASGNQLYDPNNTSADDLANLLASEQRGEMGGGAAQAWFYPMLTNTAYERGIPAGVGPGTRVIHKVGFIDGNVHDAGIVMVGPEKGYVIVVLTDGNDDGWGTIAQISGAVWSYESGRL